MLSVVSLPAAHGHGRLLAPPSRASMWRFGLDNPVDYQDNEQFCGGFWHQWGVNEGKCGICGDPWDGTREHETGGKYANGIIAANYTQAQVITVLIEISAHHDGWFEFRLCPQYDLTTPVNQSCLDKHILPLANTGQTRHNITGDKRQYYTLDLQLPLGVFCEQCVFQWKYHCGNSWGTDDDGTSGIGHGPQEEFYGCADIAIAEDSSIVIPITTTTTPGPTTTTTTAPTTPSPEPCVPSVTYEEVLGMVKWCEDNCGDHKAWQSPDCPVVCVCP